jgi:hypothetical protein
MAELATGEQPDVTGEDRFGPQAHEAWVRRCDEGRQEGLAEAGGDGLNERLGVIHREGRGRGGRESRGEKLAPVQLGWAGSGARSRRISVTGSPASSAEPAGRQPSGA